MRGLMRDITDAPDMVGPCDCEIIKTEAWTKTPWTNFEPQLPEIRW